MTVLDTVKVPTDLFVGGTWQPARSGRRLEVTNPSTDEVLTTVADADVEDATAAVDAAAQAAAS